MKISIKDKELSPKEQFERLKEKTKSKVEYNIVYDSLAEGLEPIYFWVLDFMKDTSLNGLGMEEVIKSKDEYEAAVGGGYFGEIGTRAGIMQDRAMKIMATVNTVVRSVINLIYDLKEFEIRLQSYDDLRSENKSKRESAELALRAIWMDNVDIKKGRGSINMLTQQLQFVTLRDAFMYVKNEEDVDKADLNERVKRILRARLNDYLKWKEYSEKEIRKRYNIERSYLKSQYNALKLYSKWAKPYLIAAQKLGMSNFVTASGQPNPNIVNVFNNLEIHLNLFGKMETKPEELNPAFEGLKLPEKYYTCVEAEIIFRTVPRAMQAATGSQHYVHSGRTELIFRAYGLTDKEIKKMNELRDKEDLQLIEEMTETSLKEIREDIDHFLKDEKEEEKAEEEEKPKFENPFKGVVKGFGAALKPLKYVGRVFPKFRKSPKFIEGQIKKKALSIAEGKCYFMYDIYKKSHRMMTW